MGVPGIVPLDLDVAQAAGLFAAFEATAQAAFFRALGSLGFSDLLLRGLDIYSGKHVTNPKVTVHRARKVEATNTDGGEVLLDVDGEAPGRLPATFELIPGGLKVRASA